MKKITMIGTIALIFAVVFTGCANPNGGNTEPSAEAVTVNDITKPNSYTPSFTSKAVISEGDALKVLNSLQSEFIYLITAPAMDMGRTFIADKKNEQTKTKLEKYQKTLKDKKTSGESYNETCSVDFVPGYYEKDFGSYKNLYYSMTMGKKFDKDTKIDTEINNASALYTIDVKDLKAMVEYLEKKGETIESFRVMKAAKYSTKSISNSTTTSTPSYPRGNNVTNGENTTNGAVLFDNNEYKGIVVFDLHATITNSVPSVKVNATFYDINGKNPHGPFTLG